jgi:predicted branched-subunit amino acid permease
MALRYREEGGTDTAIVLGSGAVLWLVWIAGTVAGFLIGAAVADPQRYGLDVILPVFFTALLVPMWRGARAAVPWAVAGAAALLAAWALPGGWYIIIGTIAGAIAGGMQDERA